MFVMHFYLVCNMNKIVRALVVYIFVLAITRAAETSSKDNTSTITTKWKKTETTTRWKEPTSTTKQKELNTRWQEPSTTTKQKELTTMKWREPSTTTKQKDLTTTRWREPTTTAKQKELTTTRWREPTTPNKGKYSTTSTTTTRRTEPTTVRNWRQPITTRATPTTRRAYQAPVNHGVVAVASFAGVDSRNGRLSPMSGIKIYPHVDSSMVKSDDKGNFIFKSVNGKMPTPITITKQGDGVSGTIRISPGSVSVSSSASSSSKSGPAMAVAASYNPWSTYMDMKPIMNDIYFPPFPTFPSFPSMPDPMFQTFPDTSYHKKMTDPFSYLRIQDPTYPSLIQDPWFNKDMFKQSQRKHDIYQPNWFYPSFNPFINYWR